MEDYKAGVPSVWILSYVLSPRFHSNAILRPLIAVEALLTAVVGAPREVVAGRWRFTHAYNCSSEGRSTWNTPS